MKEQFKHFILHLIFCIWYFGNEVHPIFFKIDHLLFLKYTVAYTLIGWCSYWLIQKKNKNTTKSWVLSQLLLIFLLLYGYSKDKIGMIIPAIDKHTLFATIWIGIFGVLFYKVYRSNKSYQKFQQFWSVCLGLFMLVLIYDIFKHQPKEIKITNNYTVSNPPQNLPDIYLIVFDELTRLNELEQWNYDTDGFKRRLAEAQLQYIPNAFSYSDATPISIAGILNSKVIELNDLQIPLNNFEKYNLWDYYEQNHLSNYLQQLGYDRSLYGIANFQNLENYTGFNFLNRLDKQILRKNTLIGKLNDDIGWNLIKYNIPILKSLKLQEEDQQRKAFFENDSLNLVGLKNAIQMKKEHPKFVMGHFYFPHYPYSKDSMGNYKPFINLEENAKENIQGYLEQVKYTEKVMIEIQEMILQNEKPTIAIFLGDHGYRSSNISDLASKSFLAYYTNGKDLPTSDSTSSVNLMRIIMNEYFGYSFEMDSSRGRLLYD